MVQRTREDGGGSATRGGPTWMAAWSILEVDPSSVNRRGCSYTGSVCMLLPYLYNVALLTFSAESVLCCPQGSGIYSWHLLLGYE